MKRLLLWTVIGLITMTTTSCQSKQEILDQMEQELSKMRQNVDTYSSLVSLKIIKNQN